MSDILKEYNTTIDTLGVNKIPSTIGAPYVEEEKATLPFDRSMLGNEYTGTSTLDLELAGPRSHTYFNPTQTKCAIVTCGGLCPGLNDVIRSIVMSCYNTYNVASVIGIQYGLEGFIPKYNHKIKELTPATVADIHNFGGTVLGTSRGPQQPEEIVDTLERMNVNVLFLIGGDGSMKAAQKIIEAITKRRLKISVIGIPKTIDNDIHFVPKSFGFGTAVEAATNALTSAHVEAQGAHNGIGLVKLMGRESGFIAAQAVLSYSIANFILIPESPFALRGEGGFLPALEKRLVNRGHAVIVVAEGAGQDLFDGTGKVDASGNPVLVDIGQFLATEIKEYFKEKEIPCTLKLIDPSYLIRSVPANSDDKVYCGFLGRYAVDAAMAGKTNMVVAKIMDKFVHIPIDIVTKKRSTLNTKSQYWKSVLRSTGQKGMKGQN